MISAVENISSVSKHHQGVLCSFPGNDDDDSKDCDNPVSTLVMDPLSRQEGGDQQEKPTEKKEALDALLECIDILSKLASLDCLTYNACFVNNADKNHRVNNDKNNMDGSSSSGSDAIYNSSPSKNNDDEDALILQSRLDKIQNQWQLEQTSIIHISQSIHKLQSNMIQLVNENNKQQMEYNTLQSTYNDAVGRIHKLEHCVDKLHKSNKKLKMKIKHKESVNKSVIKQIKHYILSMKKQQKAYSDLSLEEQQIKHQLKAHEHLLKIQKTVRKHNDEKDNLSCNRSMIDNEKEDTNSYNVHNRDRTTTFDTFDISACSFTSGGGGGGDGGCNIGNRSRISTLDSMSSDFGENVFDYSDLAVGCNNNEELIHHSHHEESDATESIVSSTNTSINSYITDDGVPSVRFIPMNNATSKTIDIDKNMNNHNNNSIDSSLLLPSTEMEVATKAAAVSSMTTIKDKDDNISMNNGHIRHHNHPWSPLKAAFNNTKDKFLLAKQSSPSNSNNNGNIHTITFSSREEINIQFIEVPLYKKKKSNDDNIANKEPTCLISNAMLHSSTTSPSQQESSENIQEQQHGLKFFGSKKTAFSRGNTNDDENCSRNIKKELPFRFASMMFNKGNSHIIDADGAINSYQTSINPNSKTNDGEDSNTISHKDNKDNDIDDSEVPVYAFLVCGYTDNDPSRKRSIRQSLVGSRLISVNDISLEDDHKYKNIVEIFNDASIDDATAFASSAITTTTTASSNIVLKFRNESLNKKQRALLRKAVKEVENVEEKGKHKSKGHKEQPQEEEERAKNQLQQEEQPSNKQRYDGDKSNKEHLHFGGESRQGEKYGETIECPKNNKDEMSQGDNLPCMLNTDNKTINMTMTPSPGNTPSSSHGHNLQRKMESMSKKFKSLF